MRALTVCVVLALVLSSGVSALEFAGAEPPEGRTEPAVAAPSAAPTVGMVGDSLSWQAGNQLRYWLGQSHRLVYFDAVIGGTVAGQRASVVNAVRSPGGPDILLIELGTNDAGRNHSVQQFAADVRATLDAVTPHVDAVVWFDLKNHGSGYYRDFNRNARAFNGTLREVVAGYPKAWVLDYSVWADAIGPRGFVADLVHLSMVGELELALMAKTAADGFDPGLRSGPYWDVRDGFWAAVAINWSHAANISLGYPNGSYRAVLGTVRFHVTRAQMARMLWVANGSPGPFGPHGWSDGPIWVAQPLNWLAAARHATGYFDGTFRPDNNITRAELARMLYRIAGWPDVSGLPAHGFPDVPPWVQDAVTWVKAVGIVLGYPDNTFRPDALVTRAQVANWLYYMSTALPAAEPPTTTTTAPPTTTTTATTVTATTAPPATAPQVTVPEMPGPTEGVTTPPA